MKDLMGKVVGGCEILEELGQGGMGVVYKAKQISLDRLVAIKVLAQHLALDKNFVRRFQHEAHAIARVSHPNILTIFDVGEENGIYYIVMELISGRSVAEMLEEIPRLEPRFAGDIGRQAALGLECAQQNGIVHRDIKPDNIMITNQTIAKVSDFGLAKEVEGSMTVTDAVMGTPAYMSPEQCDGKKLDGRTDIYSLGGTLYRMITGRLPFEAETAMSMMYRHKHEPLVPPQEVVEEVPPSLGHVIVKMMAKQREDRFQTMGEVVQALDGATREGESREGEDGARRDTSSVLEATIKLNAEQPAGGQASSAAGATPGGAALTTTEPDAGKAKELLAEAESSLSRGDAGGAARLLGEAARFDPDNKVVKERLTSIVAPEVSKLLDAGKKMLVAGQYSEAVRSFRNALDLDPANEQAQEMLRTGEHRLLKKREAINEIRNLIREAKFEEVVARWDKLPPEVREKNLDKQVDRIRTVTIPAVQVVKQADSAAEEGRLEEARELYQKVLQLDANNQRAKEGIKEIERRKTRLDVLLREGYEAFMNREFDRAIDTWRNAYKVSPDPQVKKRIVDAYMELVGDLEGKEGGLPRIVKTWEEILALDPGNSRARVRLEQDRKRLERVSHLGEKASRSFSRKQYGAAVRSWKVMLSVDPHNRKVAASLKAAKNRLWRRRLRVLLGAAVLVVVLGSAAQYYVETRLLEWAEEAMARGQYQGAQAALKSGYLPFLIFRSKRDEMLDKARVQALAEQFRWALGREDAAEAERLLEEIGRLLKDAKEKKRLEQKVRALRLRKAVSEAGAALAKGDFAGAASHLGKASTEAAAAGNRSNAESLTQQARLYLLLSEAKQALAAGDRAVAAARLREAHRIGIEDRYLEGFLERTGFDFELADRELGEAYRSVNERHYADAKRPLEKILDRDPSRTEAAVVLAFVEDNLYCEKKRMALVPPKGSGNILVNPHWRPADRRKAFCIDRYEYPNKAGETPLTNVSYLQAKAACARQGKRLCTVTEWSDACTTHREYRFSYGPAFLSDACNTSDQDKAASGSKKRCRNVYGVYDMVGNVAEWVENPATAGTGAQHYLMGGFFGTSPPQGASCYTRTLYPGSLSAAHVGFRCCADLPKKRE